MERITKLTTSQVKCFKTCRKRYFFEYVEMLKPIETPKALELGTLYHYGLELLLTGTDIDAVAFAIVERQALAVADKGIDVEVLPALIASEMVRAFDRDSDWRSWKIVAVEKRFEVTTGYAKRLLGKIDGVTEQDGKSFLIEHKTTSQWGKDGEAYLHNLLWDEQSTNYLYAYQRMLEDGVIEGGQVSGIFYTIVEKPTIKPYSATPMEKRKYTKEGALYAGQHDRDETPEEFARRVRDWYAADKRVHTAFVYRTAADIAEHIADFNLTLKDINAAERDGTFYRNPEACKILPCPYRSKCLDNVPDTDCLFTKKTTKNEELA